MQRQQQHQAPGRCDRCGGVLRFAIGPCEDCAADAEAERRRGAEPQPPCKHCGAPLPADRGARRLYCCRRCLCLAKAKRVARRRVLAFKRCVACGVGFRPADPRKRCCSQGCERERQRRNAAVRYHAQRGQPWRKGQLRSDPLQKRCVVCGAGFVCPTQKWRTMTCGEACARAHELEVRRRRHRERRGAAVAAYLAQLQPLVGRLSPPRAGGVMRSGAGG